MLFHSLKSQHDFIWDDKLIELWKISLIEHSYHIHQSISWWRLWGRVKSYSQPWLEINLSKMWPCLLSFSLKGQISDVSFVSLWSPITELARLLHLVVRKQRDFLSSVGLLSWWHNDIIHYDGRIASVWLWSPRIYLQVCLAKYLKIKPEHISIHIFSTTGFSNKYCRAGLTGKKALVKNYLWSPVQSSN